MVYVESHGPDRTRELGREPTLHEPVSISESELGAWTEVRQHARLNESAIGDYTYLMERVQLDYATVGKFGNVAADVRVGPVTSESFELAVDVGFTLVAAEAVLRGALEREESRGAHYRTDRPDVDPEWRRNVYVDAADVGGMTLRTEPVDEPSQAVQAALDEGHELDYHQLE